MIRATPNNSFNDSTRHVDTKVLVYFDAAPVTFYSSDYLVDANVIEESSGETKNPLGAVTANEFTFSLANLNDIFTPSNPDSPYFGKIKVGIRVEPFICSTLDNLAITPITDVGITWISLGKFRVTNWTAKAGSLIADISATDAMQDILSMSLPRMVTLENTTFSDVVKALFADLKIKQYSIKDGMDNTKLAFVPFDDSDTVPSVLQRVSEASISAVYADRNGVPTIRTFLASEPQFTLTDNDQIISIDTQQSILKAYNGVDLTFYRYQLSALTDLLSVKDLLVPVGSFTHGPYSFEKPLYKISAIKSEAEGAYFVPINSFDACSSNILLITSYGEESAIEAGIYELMNGTKADKDGYNRGSNSFLCTVGTSYSIYTEALGNDNTLTVLFYAETELVQYLDVVINEEGVCHFVVPEPVLNKKIKVELGAFSYSNGSKKDEATNLSRFPIFIKVIPGSTYTVDTLNKSMVGEAFNAFYYDATQTFVSHETITITRKGTGEITIPNGVEYLKCHFSTSIVPVGTEIPVSGRTTAVQNSFTFYGLDTVLKLGDNVTVASESATGSGAATITVQGVGIESTKLSMKDQVSNPLKVDNSLIQSAAQATAYKDKLTKFVNALIPELSLVIRGNPLMELGDVISVQSTKYKVTFTGILKRAEYSFNGSLSCNITLLNVEVLS